MPPIELLSPHEMAVADRRAVQLGHSVASLMENAGRAVARAIRARFAPCRTLVLCGPGNNGGDGLAAARLLGQRGWPVTVARLGEPGFSAIEAARAELVVDAVFGAGLSRPLHPGVLAVLRAARRIVAIDIPSGIDGATGAGVSAQAALTVTFFRLKPGHKLLPGRDLCGELVLADIGLPAAVLEMVMPHTYLDTPQLWTLPVPGASSHKFSRGHVTVIGGAAMTGAARLAAAAARRGGAGLVTIAALGSAAAYRNGDPGVIVDEAPVEAQLRDARRNAWVAGPGLGIAAARQVLPRLLAAGRQVVVDADALSACAGAPERLLGAAVLTPHAGEFARVFGPLPTDRLASVRAAAARVQAVVVLKGSDSIVAAPDGRVAINDSAPPWLATAGAGDVLAGLVGALLAQGMPAWEAACAAVWLHGEAAAECGSGLIAEDLTSAFPVAFRRALAAAAR